VPVCITGMHRSGTSMVAHALSVCGLDLGPEDGLLAADDWNSDGYWENRKLLELDDWALEQLGGSWDMPPSAAADAELRSSFVAAAQQAVAEIGFREPWAWKDPRACLLADLWQEAVPDLRFVVVVRNPVEVSLSLLRRGATSARLGLSLWSTYYAELLARVSPADRVVVSYDAFLEDPAGSVDRLVARLGLDAKAGKRKEAAATVDVSLRHHANDPANVAAMSEQLVELYEALSSEARDGTPAEPPHPDSIPRPLRPAAGGFANEVLVAAYSERDALRRQVQGLTADRDNWRKKATSQGDSWRTQVEEKPDVVEEMAPGPGAAPAGAGDGDHDWREESRRLQADRDAWRTEARHWRSETERLINAEQQRLGWRLRRARLRYARRAWHALPAGVRNQVRPLIFRETRFEFIAPEPLQKDESPPARLPARPPGERRSGRTAAPRQPIDVRVSVVIPTFNAGADAALFLAALERQVGVPQLELVVADSGSTDGTRERFAAAADVVLDIAPGEFGHGRTRNAAFAASSGEVVVMTVQDALLLGPHALHDLVHELLSDDGLAAVSARQVPRSSADLYGAYNVVSHYKALWRDGRHAKPNDPLYRRAAAGVDDVCAAIRRATWEQGIQYRDVDFGEDVDFGMRALDAGWRIALSDDVAVAHSHTRDARYQFRRSVADRLNIAGLVSENTVCRSSTAGEVAEIAAAGRALLCDVAASLALSGESDERLSLLFERVAERAVTPLTTMEPSRGQLALLAEFLAEIADDAQPGEVSAPLRLEFARLLQWPLLVEFADAQRAPSPDAVDNFVACLAATLIGRSVGDRLRVHASPDDRARMLVGV
jgi:GT2 family glycosyltransferase